GLHRAERFWIGRDLVARRIDERARDPHVAGWQLLVALDLDRGKCEERVVAVPRGPEDGLGEILLEAPPVLLELREVRWRERDHVRVGNEGLAQRDGLMRFHRADHALGDLNRLKLCPEKAGAPALDDPARERFKPFHASL